MPTHGSVHVFLPSILFENYSARCRQAGISNRNAPVGGDTNTNRLASIF